MKSMGQGRGNATRELEVFGHREGQAEKPSEWTGDGGWGLRQDRYNIRMKGSEVNGAVCL
jgi:hypothetical protein